MGGARDRGEQLVSGGKGQLSAPDWASLPQRLSSLSLWENENKDGVQATSLEVCLKCTPGHCQGSAAPFASPERAFPWVPFSILRPDLYN